jgi:hypothetical protein
VHKRVFILAFLACVSAAPSAARAERPTFGISVNLSSGRQQQSDSRSTALPNVPVPMLSVRVPLKRFVFVAEGLPPIGPVSYNDGLEATKLSYVAGGLRWRTPDDRFEIGAGTTLVNQSTDYPKSFFLRQQDSRVAGFRVTAQFALENTLAAQTRVRISLSPSMHGLQVSKVLYGLKCPGLPPFPTPPGACAETFRYVDDAELASLLDAQLSRTQSVGRFGLSYGVRYINYAARFAVNGRQADRERMFMPFVGVDVPFGR